MILNLFGQAKQGQTWRKDLCLGAVDSETGKPWPRMLSVYLTLAHDMAASAGFEEFGPDACLIDCYKSGARLSLHPGKNERDFEAPLVSISLGLPAVFLFGGSHRSDNGTATQLFALRCPEANGGNSPPAHRLRPQRARRAIHAGDALPTSPPARYIQPLPAACQGDRGMAGAISRLVEILERIGSGCWGATEQL